MGPLRLRLAVAGERGAKTPVAGPWPLGDVDELRELGRRDIGSHGREATALLPMEPEIRLPVGGPAAKVIACRWSWCVVPGEAARWGWHRLHNDWVRRLVDAAGVARGDLVIDVGAGEGAITAELLRRGARVIAVELHPRRAALLRQQFANERVTVVRADASDLRLPRQPFKVVANLPFAVTTASVRRLTSPSSRLDRASLIVPAWAAARWSSSRGPATRHFAFGASFRDPARAFSPAPPRDARVLLVERR